MAVGQPSLHSLQRFSEKEVPEEMRGEEMSSLGGEGSYRHANRKHAGANCGILAAQ
jgi:hypothetical protein